MTREQAEAAVRKHGGIRPAGRALGIPHSTISKALKRNSAKPAASSAVVGQAVKKVGKSLSDFRAQYDKDFIVPNKIKTALRELGAGWEYEVSFSKLSGVSLADLGNYRDQFEQYIVSLRDKRRAWAGNPSTAKAMREMV